MIRTFAFHPLVLVVALAACSESQSKLMHSDSEPHTETVVVAEAADAEALTYYKDIKPLMDVKCASCHTPQGLAGFGLSNYKQVKAMRNAIKRAVETRKMPPWLGEAGHQTYRDDLSLSAEEISKIVSWVNLGAKEGDPAQYQEASKAASFTPDLNIPIFTDAGAYLPLQASSDEYRCFIIPFDSMLGDSSYITGFAAVAGNKKIVHHLVAYTASAEILPVLNELDAEEDGRGYRCTGGALPDRLGDPAFQAALEAKHPGMVQKLNAENYWLAHWAPGMDGGYAFPEGTGIKVPKGGAFVIQMHYYTGAAKNEADQNTIFSVKLAKTVEKPAFYYPLTDTHWLLSRQNKDMVILAGKTASHTAEATLARVAAFGQHVLGLPSDSIKNLEVHSANLHMHELGTSGTITITELGTGIQDVLLNIPQWNLHWQRDFQFVQPKVFGPADWTKYVNKVTCNYQNNRETDAFGGFGSLDEMCFNFGFYAFELNAQP